MPEIFDIEFQRCLLAALWNDPKFFSRNLASFDISLFGDEVLSGLFSALKATSGRTGALPDLGEATEALKPYVAPGRKWGEYVTETKRVWKRRGTNEEYYKKRALEFVRKQAVARAVGEAHKHLESGDYDQISNLIQKALKTGQGEASSYYDFLAEAKDRAKKYAHRLNGRSTGRVPTGVGPLDEAIHGGLGPGEIGCVVALPKHGKSTMLVNFGVHALLGGTNVLHVTLENSRTLCASRYDVRLFGRPYEKMKKLPKSFLSSMRELAGKLKSRLEIAHFPTKSLSVSELAGVVLGASNPGLVIVDYAALMRSAQKREEKRFELSDIFESLRRVASEVGVPIWTAHQANRPGIRARVLGFEHLAECFEVAGIVDLACSITHDEMEQRRGEIIFNVIGSRIGRSGFEIPCFADWSLCKISTYEEELDDAS